MSHHAQRAQFFLERSRYDLAEKEARDLLACDPQDAQGRAVLARCRIHQQRVAEAVEEVRQAISSAPQWAYPHYLLGWIHHRQGRLPQAERAHREAVRLAPQDEDFYAALAEVLFAQGRRADALEVANHGLQLNPEHTECLHLRALALAGLGRADEARATIDMALHKNPENAGAHADKGQALLEQGDHSGALGHFREALRIAPDLGRAKRGLELAQESRTRTYGGSSVKWYSTPTRRSTMDEETRKVIFVILAAIVVAMNFMRATTDSSSRGHLREANLESVSPSQSIRPFGRTASGPRWNDDQIWSSAGLRLPVVIRPASTFPTSWPLATNAASDNPAGEQSQAINP